MKWDDVFSLVLNDHGFEVLFACDDRMMPFAVFVGHVPDIARADISDLAVAGRDLCRAGQTDQFLRDGCRVDGFIPTGLQTQEQQSLDLVGLGDLDSLGGGANVVSCKVTSTTSQ